MRKACPPIAAASVASLLLALGCGGDGSVTVEDRKTDPSQFEQMKDMMTKNVKSKNFVAKEAPKAAETK